MSEQGRSLSKEERVRLEGEDYKKFVQAIFKRDSYRCRNPRCGSSKSLTPHHIRKRSHHGGDTPENVITLCVSCHDEVERNELVVIPVDTIVKIMPKQDVSGRNH